MQGSARQVTARKDPHVVVYGVVRMDQVDVNIAVFTNLATDAAEAGGEQDALLAAKGALFRRLSDPNLQRAIINIDGAAPRPAPGGPALGSSAEARLAAVWMPRGWPIPRAEICWLEGRVACLGVGHMSGTGAPLVGLVSLVGSGVKTEDVLRGTLLRGKRCLAVRHDRPGSCNILSGTASPC